MNYLVEVVKKYLNQDDAGVVEKTTFNNIFSAAGYFQSLAWYTFVSTFILGGDEDDAIRNAIDSANAASRCIGSRLPAPGQKMTCGFGRKVSRGFGHGVFVWEEGYVLCNI